MENKMQYCFTHDCFKVMPSDTYVCPRCEVAAGREKLISYSIARLLK